MTESLLTPVARRYAAKLARTIAPSAARLDQRFGKFLSRRYDALRIGSLMAVTPAAASRVRTLRGFLEQVECHGERLAKLNVPPAEVKENLGEFGRLLDSILGERFQPAREQLLLATMMVLEAAYHRVREAEAQTFFGLYQAEGEAQDLEDLLRRFVRILTRTFRARCGRLILDSQRGKEVSRALYIEHGQTDEKLIADSAMRGHYASYWSYPLGDSAIIQLGFAKEQQWLPRELALLEAAAGRCRAAMERVRLESEVRRLDALARHAEEGERRRIGRELHDEAGQSLLLLRLQLEMLERQAPARLRPRLAEARILAGRTVENLRRIVAALSPAVLEHLGLEAALRQLGARFCKMHTAELQIRIALPSQPVAVEAQEVIYRVAQECLQNVAKHSGASVVKLSLHVADKRIRLSVMDNGAGFNAERACRKPMSFGLAGMRERAALLGGTLAVRSWPHKGCTVALQLPRTPARMGPNVEDSHTLD